MSVQLTFENIGRVKYNPIFCDSDGTVNPSGEYIKFDTAYDKLVKADTTDVLFNDADATEVVSKVLPYEDSVYNDQIFISATNGIIAVYDEAQTEPCFSKIALKLDLYEYGYDSEGVMEVDSEGVYVTAPKLTTTVY